MIICHIEALEPRWQSSLCSDLAAPYSAIGIEIGVTFLSIESMELFFVQDIASFD